jgi:aminoglycoside 3-N-acetyltransferase
MLNKEINIADTFKSLGVLPNEVVMIHGDAGVAAQFTHINSNQRVQELIRQIIEYFSPEGTVVVPTFSYSFTKNENFDVSNTPGEIGKFSELFRQYQFVCRSSHPIFSVAGIGKHFEKFEKSRIDDCFGEGTAFDLLYKLGGKIICLGCDFARGATFMHYVEQSLGVPYRYMKNFSGHIIKEGKKDQLTTSYYVRKLEMNSILDFNFLKKELTKQGKLLVSNMGRFPVLAIKTHDFLNCSIQLLKNNNFFLTKNEI